MSWQVDLKGLTLTWLGSAAPPPRLALRLRRSGASSELADCTRIELVLDGTSMPLPAKYKATSDALPVHETLQAELDEPKLATIVAAQVVHLKACGLTRRLTYAAGLAGSHVLKAYKSMLAEKGPLPERSTVPETEATTLAPETSPGERGDLGLPPSRLR